MKNFQIIILIIFIAAAIFGVLVFSGTIPLGDQSKEEGSGGTVVLWGTVRAIDISKPLEDFNRENRVFTLQYVEKRAETFDQDLLEALASGVGPDLFFISDDLAYKYSNKITTIPYQSYPLATFRQNFVGGGEVFLTSGGFLAFPLSVDPMVMYYNRTILDDNNIVYPPEFWDQLSTLAPTLSRKDESGRLLKSAVALGQFSNVAHAKDILSTFFMQAGNPIVSERGNSFRSVLEQPLGTRNSGAMLASYADYANPLSPAYSWNRSLPNSRDSFSAENLAFYFGFASELQTLVERNPNQNFMVAAIPQLREAGSKLTSARVLGIAVSSASKNANSAFQAANLLTTTDFAKEFATATGTAPARREFLSAAPENAYQPVFYSSALFARAWLDPSSADTDQIFREMVEKVLSSNLTPDNAVREASSKMNLLFIR